MSKTKEKTLLQQHMEDFEKTRSATGANYAASAGGADAVRESVRNVIGSIEESGLEEFTLTGEAKRTNNELSNGEFGLSLMVGCDQLNCPLPPLFVISSMLINEDQSDGHQFNEPGAAYDAEFELDKENLIGLLEFQVDVVIPAIAYYAAKPNSSRYPGNSLVSPVAGIA